MRYLFKILMLFFSLGILLYPAQNSISQNSKEMSCCSIKGVCHKNLPENQKKNSNSHDCCNISVSFFQFIKSDENLAVNISLNKSVENKFSFFYSNSSLLNTLLEGVFQPPKFI